MGDIYYEWITGKKEKRMTDKQIKTAIRNCYWRYDGFKGKDRSDHYVICRGYCEPCLKVIDSGKCDTLIELFKGEREDEK